MIDPAIEQTFPLKNPSAFGCRRCYSTVRKWAIAGSENRWTGEVVVLETIFVGQQRETSREAYVRFLQATNQRKGVPHGQEQEDDGADSEDQAGQGEGDAA